MDDNSGEMFNTKWELEFSIEKFSLHIKFNKVGENKAE
jgi:hypothetical protein